MSYTNKNRSNAKLDFAYVRRLVVFVKFKNSLIHSIYNVARGNLTAEYRRLKLRLLFSLKPKEMAKMRLLAIWIEVKL